MKSKAKILLLMAISLVFVSVFSFSASAAKVVESGQFHAEVGWKLYDDGTLKIIGNGPAEYWIGGIIPALETKSPESVKRIEIGEGVTHCDGAVFRELVNVTQITYPKDSFEVFDHDMYRGKYNITSYTIPSSVIDFRGNSLSTYVKNIYVEKGNQRYKSIDGVLFSYDGKTLVRYPDGRTDTTYVIPAGVTKINEWAFCNSASLNSVVIPESVTEIDRCAFQNCTSLSNVVIPDSVTIIRSSAFENCTSLNNVRIPRNVTRIESKTFYNTALNSVVIPEWITSLDLSAFFCPSLKSITIPEGVVELSIHSMNNNSFQAIYVDDANPNYFSENGVLYSKNDNTLLCYPSEKADEVFVIPNFVKGIENHAFNYLKNTKCIIIPTNVKNIATDAFTCTDNLSVYIPYSTKIEYSAFGSEYEGSDWRCVGATIYGFSGSSAERFVNEENRYNAFLNFVPITEEEYQSKFNGLLSGTFPNGVTYNLSYNYVLTISGTGAIPDFEAGKAPWYAYADKINTVVIDKGITSIGACAFYGCKNIYSLSLPDSITSIGYAAFHSCCGLSGFIVPQNVTAIGDYAFFGCTGLEYVTLYPGLSYIGAHAFDGCTGIERINLPDTITYIGDYAFSGCVSILEIVIPVGVTEIRPYVFNMCTGLVKVVIHSKVEIIDYTSFCGCICHIHGYNESYAQKYAQGLEIVFVPLKFMWAENSEWGTEELKKADELQLFPENLKEKDLSQSITREEFASVAVKVYERLTGTSVLPSIVNPFTDTNNIDVLKAYNAGITTGVSETQFAPNALLNREQAATMLTRVFKKATIPGWNVGEDANYPLVYDVPPAFWDDADISSWAKESVYFMVANGIVSGVGNNMFAPRNTTTEHEAIAYANATREQALIIAVRMIEKLSK